MLTVISPAKTLDCEAPSTTRKTSVPQFLDSAAELVQDMQSLSPDEIRELMSVSEGIAQLNHRRFMNWAPPFSLENAKQSVLAFKGTVYTGLQADTFSARQFNYAQRHLCILSGLYGLLRPLDLIQAYRLEMGLKFINRRGNNLYQFWGSKITHGLNAQLKKNRADLLVNLASMEYFKAIKLGELNADVITPVFKDMKSGKYKIISVYAKKARGQMARFIIDNEVTDPDGLRKYDCDGYRYNKGESTARTLVFTRKKEG
ncbi:MAG: peroxide stress protein YaaA [Halieaceae bacterium]|jgi:uncharacterized protein|nr:peroxide stress protein YaaA [Halieaceae bacterium]